MHRTLTQDRSTDLAAQSAGESAGAWIRWTASSDPASGQPFSLELRAAAGKPPTGCLVSTAGNTNNTLAIVSEVREDGRAIALSAPTSDGKLAAAGSFEMQVGRTCEPRVAQCIQLQIQIRKRKRPVYRVYTKHDRHGFKTRNN